MELIKLNRDWQFTPGEVNLMAAMMGGGQEAITVDLPHDAMVLEKRSADTGNGGHTGFYPGGVYTYVKTLAVPEEWKSKDVYLEFEGVHANAMVYVNNDLVMQRPYGYSEFHALLNDFLLLGADNEIKVVCNTAMEHQSRWYTGSGIYRDVNLYVADTLHTQLNGVKITTPDIDGDAAMVEVDLLLENNSRHMRNAAVTVELLDRSGKTVNREESPLTMHSRSTTGLRQRLPVENPALWSCDTPSLYTCVVRISENGNVIDENTSTFGIRKLQLDAKRGLRINGVETKLRGACIHHDNGVVGAATFPRAEERRAEQLKEAGFNCIRSAHNPLSRAMLNACDRLGLLVMDETFDVWMKPKSSNDYSNFFLAWWEQDLEAMVQKDFNHPCVIMYSLGNELPDVSNRFGKEWNRKLTNKIRCLDNTRFITNSLNLMMCKGFRQIAGIVMQEMGVDMQAAGGEGDNSGANALNGMMAMMLGPVSDKIMTHEIIDAESNEVYSALDIASMNYSPAKYAADHVRHPNRVVLGSEDFPGDIVRLWGEVKKYPSVIGDMTWTGYDYLGEAGSGTFNYDGSITFGSPYPARAAGMGDIDIIGNRLPISYLREIVYGLRKTPYIGVERVNRYGQPVCTTPWRLHDDIASWTWPGYENRPAKVYVYAASEEVELLLNGTSLGTAPAGEANGYTAVFETTYQPGELVAVGYTEGKEDGRMALQTAADKIMLQACADRDTIQADGCDLAYVMIKLCDENGVWNRAAKKAVTVAVEGAATLQGFGNADPFSEGDFFGTTWETYDGAVLAVVRAGKASGEVTIKVSAEGCEDVTVKVQIK